MRAVAGIVAHANMTWERTDLTCTTAVETGRLSTAVMAVRKRGAGAKRAEPVPKEFYGEIRCSFLASSIFC